MIDEARQPKKNPPELNGGEFISMKGDQLQASAGGSMLAALDKIKSHQWHDEMSEAQRQVAEFIWDKMGRHQQEREPFIAGFLKEYNMSHELVVWLRLTYIFEQFTARYRSEKKENVMAVLCGLSLGFSKSINIIESAARRRYLRELINETQREGTTHFGDVNFEIIGEWESLQTNPPY